jgi:hypothetical protein
MARFLGQQWTREQLLLHVGQIEQIAGVKAVEAADGTGRGVRMFEVYTGSGLSFWVLADRALDIAACCYQGLPLAWSSAVGEVHPAYYEAAGLGWLRSFPGGLITTCGLDHFGAPSTDAGEAFGLHGRISNLPARQVSYRTYWLDDEYELEIMGQVRQARLFGENLLLQRRIRTRLGANQIWVEDTVTNEGFEPQPHMILYHCNLGFPLISADSRLGLEAAETVARDAEAEVGIAEWSSFQAPTPAYKEQVFRHRPQADAQGLVAVEIENPHLDFGLRISYNQDNLPYLFQWKMMGQGAYVLGIEPANCSAVEGRAVARERRDLPELAPGESRNYSLTFEIVRS